MSNSSNIKQVKTCDLEKEEHSKHSLETMSMSCTSEPHNTFAFLLKQYASKEQHDHIALFDKKEE